MTKSFCLSVTLAITLRLILRMGWKVFTVTAELLRAPHAYTSIFLTENKHFVPGFVSVYSLDCNSILGLRIL